MPAVFAKELLFKEASFLFCYSGNYEINSAVPFKYIKAYFKEIGAASIFGSEFTYEGLRITAFTYESAPHAPFNINRTLIRVFGDEDDSTRFLDAFRLKLLSAWG